jgi:hypothetical protein
MTAAVVGQFGVHPGCAVRAVRLVVHRDDRVGELSVVAFALG